MDSLGIWEAISMWWSGENLSSKSIGGVPVIWIGRTGKLLQFLAGTVAILELIGPAKISAWSTRLAERGRKAKENRRYGKAHAIRLLTGTISGIGTLVSIAANMGSRDLNLLILMPAIIIILHSAIVGMTAYFDKISRPLTTFLRAGESKSHPIRWVAFYVFLTGFSLDMFAS